MQSYNIKIKGPDGKLMTLGNVKEGKYGGIQVGLKAGPELAAALASLTAKDGKWVNLSILPDDGNRGQPQAQSRRSEPPLDDDVPF